MQAGFLQTSCGMHEASASCCLRGGGQNKSMASSVPRPTFHTRRSKCGNLGFHLHTGPATTSKVSQGDHGSDLPSSVHGQALMSRPFAELVSGPLKMTSGAREHPSLRPRLPSKAGKAQGSCIWSCQKRKPQPKGSMCL